MEKELFFLMHYEVARKDVTVVGGGLAGVCAAVAAARLGKEVALIQNRPVLGGNSSSEVRVWVVGATKHGVNRYSRETGIMGEMLVENQYRNPDGNPYIWDLVILEMVKAEKNIELFLNTDVRTVEANGMEENRMVQSVTGWMMGSERQIRFESPVYLDCTGDGLVGFLAGAKYRIGRESRAGFNESWAPEKEDRITLGSTILFYTKDAGEPVKYIAPSFAKDITTTSIPEKRIIRSGDNGCHYWWIEWGGELDTVYENERIRDELWSVIYGIWDYIKNSGKFDAENLTLEWVGSIPGKREYRRFVGDYMLTQNDVMGQVEFDDRVAFGGWSIDLHPPGGMYASESGSKHMQADGNYHIPFRSLYSQNVRNLLFAGRNISASHIAFGSTRVMATCAVLGEAAGVGAALSVKFDTTPRELYVKQMKTIQQTMLKQDASLLGIVNEDQDDIARQAKVEASSALKQICIDNAVERYPLERNAGFVYPVDGQLNNISLLMDVEQSTQVEMEVWETGKPQNYIPKSLLTKAVTSINKGEKQWVEFEVKQLELQKSQNVFVIIKANKETALYLSDQPVTGVLSFKDTGGPRKEALFERTESPVTRWSMKGLERKPFCLIVHGETSVYAASHIIDGVNRPYGGPHMWVSEQMKDKPEWIQISWDEHINISEIHLTFNDDVNEDLINLHHHRTPFVCIPELVKDYQIQVFKNDSWKTIFNIKGNRKRKRVHHLECEISSKSLRVQIDATNGCPRAEIIEIRVY